MENPEHIYCFDEDDADQAVRMNIYTYEEAQQQICPVPCPKAQQQRKWEDLQMERFSFKTLLNQHPR